jgi:hypothetical protein
MAAKRALRASPVSGAFRALIVAITLSIAARKRDGDLSG